MSTSVRDVLIEWNTRRVPSERTAANYLSAVSLMEAWFGGPVPTEIGFSEEQYCLFLQWLRETPCTTAAIKRPRTSRTVNAYDDTLRMLWKYAKGLGATPHACPPTDSRFPTAIPQLTVETVSPTAWSLDEVALILKFCHKAPRVPDWDELRWRGLLLSFYDTGARKAALLSCRKEAFVAQEHILEIPACVDKEKKELRRKISDDTCEILLQFPPHTMLFPYPYSEDTMLRHYKIILRAAGLPHTRRDLLHKLRRTHATEVVRQTGSFEKAQLSLNHSAVHMVKKHYVDPTKLPDQSTVDVLRRPRLAS